MNKILHTVLILLMFQFIGIAQESRIEIDFNTDWKFNPTDITEAANADFNDSAWRSLDVPHDWAFEKGVSKDGAQSDGGGYFDGGLGWYRKSFNVPASWSDKIVSIQFDGVYMNSEVWINGHYLGKRPYGYISFRYELSEYLKPGENHISVRVDNLKEPSARWYHPCGIYAPVQLVVTNRQFIAPNGIFISTPKIDGQSATVQIQTTLENRSDSKAKTILETSVLNAKGIVVAKDSQPVKWEDSKEIQINNNLEIKNPELWSPESPCLYKVVHRLLVKKKVVDEVKTNIGIRSIEWSTEKGFLLNGKVTKLLGVCEHYEGGPFGGAWTKPWLVWKLGLLKEMGVNAVRTSHNPVPPMFYDVCDEMGILVMDEIFDGWKRKAKMDYGEQAFNEWWERDITEWITRNRNHPSIIIYSLGNETSGEIAKELVETCHQLDTTRPITSGHSASKEMDVFGVNGGSEKMGFYQKDRLDKPFIATEAPHTWQTRGYYRTKTWYRDGYPNKRQEPFELPDLTEEEVFRYEWASQEKWTNRKQHFNSSYDNAMVRISARKNWELMRDLPWYSGHFRWTGFDYYGEAGYVHGGWPFRLFMGGALDVAGFEKDLFYFYQSQWTEKSMIHILPHWTHPTLERGTKIPVWIYSNCDEVELFLNGRSLGKDKPGMKWYEMQCEFLVPWEPGILLAKGFVDGKEVTNTKQITADAPAKIQLKLETKNINTENDNIAIVTTVITDSAGVFYPYGENHIFYHFDGPVRILSLENGDPVDTTLNVGINNRKAFMGLTRAFVELPANQKSIAITAGALLGEKQQLTSKRVAVDVKTIAVRGKIPNQQIQIYYTLDGTQPTTKSPVYQKPFSVDLGTTVKAIVVRNNEVILNMEEQFDKGLGLHWGDKNAEPLSETSKTGMRAVDTDFSGATIQSNNKEKYLDFNGNEGKITWYQENDGSAGKFVLKIGYACNDPRSNRPMALFINNKKVAEIEFRSTGSWNSNWQEIEITQILVAGANNIELRTTGKSGPNIMSLLVE